MKKIGALILAVGLVFGFAGCKTSTEELTLTKIEITNPADKVEYLVGEYLDTTGLEITATYSDESTQVVTGWTTSGYDKTKTGEQTVTVSYIEEEVKAQTSYTVTVKIKPFNWYETPEQLPAGTNGTYGTEGTYVLFGVWPQDVVPVADVETLGLETSTDKVTRGYMEYVKGSDGNYYVKCAENAYGSDYKYKKDDSDVKQGGTTSRWFKVMPIKWRVVDTEYDVDGSIGSESAKLLVAENILTSNVPYYESTSDRTISGSTVYANNYMHSQIRAYLNGISYNAADSANENKWYDNANSKGKGFLQTAFGDTAQQTIITTEVNNNGESTTDVGKNLKWANGKEKDGVTDSGYADYTCENTQDKIFLLSEYEVTKYSKSTEKYNSDGPGNSRIRVPTDFANANYAYQYSADYGGYWWLRSPYYDSGDYARDVSYFGNARGSTNVYNSFVGVVPALSISF